MAEEADPLGFADAGLIVTHQARAADHIGGEDRGEAIPRGRGAL